jgi:hypothetical protein
MGGNQLSPGDRELARAEYVAVEGPAATPATTEIGPLDLEVGLGVTLACSGPSNVSVMLETDVLVTGFGGFSPLMSRCVNGDTAGGQVPWWVLNTSARFIVTANPDTSWQLVIFDPAPE